MLMFASHFGVCVVIFEPTEDFMHWLMMGNFGNLGR